jgi:hypothetical protein
MVKCKTKTCRKKVKGGHCSACRARKARERDPVKAAFYNKRNNAKRDGIPFTLTLEQWRELCYEYKFYKSKKHSGKSFSIDRIDPDPSIGYVPGNVQCMTVAENASKGKRFLSYDYYTKTAKYY